MLGVRNQRQEDQERCGVRPPQRNRTGIGVLNPEGGQIGHHQGEDKERDEAGLVGNFAQPTWTDDQPSNCQSQDRHGNQYREQFRGDEIKGSSPAIPIDQRKPETLGNMVDRNQRKRAKAPENKGVSQAGQGTLPDHFGLQQHFPDEIPNARSEGVQVESRIRFRLADFPDDLAETMPESVHRGDQEREK